MPDKLSATALIHPKKLESGNTIGIAAPSSPFDERRFHDGIALLERMGFNVQYDSSIFIKSGYLAGSDKRRLDELHSLVKDDSISAILSARGGYGAMRLLPDLDYDAISAHPKIWIGFSDLSALHMAIRKNSRLLTIHGPQLITLPDASDDAREHLFKLIGEAKPYHSLFPSRLDCWNCGKAEGLLLPSNLTLLTQLIGTSYLPEFDGAILAIEDVGESAYRIDRMLTHLELAGVFSKIAGLITGQFNMPEKDSVLAKQQVRERVTELAAKYNLPTAGNAPFGHIPNNFALPSGTAARLDADAGSLTILESAVS